MTSHRPLWNPKPYKCVTTWCGYIHSEQGVRYQMQIVDLQTLYQSFKSQNATSTVVCWQISQIPQVWLGWEILSWFGPSGHDQIPRRRVGVRHDTSASQNLFTWWNIETKTVDIKLFPDINRTPEVLCRTWLKSYFRGTKSLNRNIQRDVTLIWIFQSKGRILFYPTCLRLVLNVLVQSVPVDKNNLAHACINTPDFEPSCLRSHS